MKKILFILVSSLMNSLSIFAAESEPIIFTQNGIRYETTGENTCAVIPKNADIFLGIENYKGDIVIPDSVTYKGNVYHVTEIKEGTFSRCQKLTSVSIPQSVTEIKDRAFSRCHNLTSVSIPQSVTEIGHWAFDGCWGLTSIDIPDSVTKIGFSAFSECYELESVTLPKHLTIIGQRAFYNCTKLTSVTIPETVTKIWESAFGNTALKEVTIPKAVIKIGEGAFVCGKLTHINVDSENPNYTSVDGVLFSKDMSALIQYPAGKPEPTYQFPEATSTICPVAFYGCQNLVYITIPETITTIDGGAFEWCGSLTHLTLPNSIQAIGEGAFNSCNKLCSVTYLAENPIETGNFAFCYFDQNTTLNYLASAKDKIDSTYPWNKFPNRIGRDADFVASVSEVAAPHPADGAVYDLQGRRVANPGRGLYIINGRKTLLR